MTKPTIAKTAEDILGFEYDWLAMDADGHVALFSTAGAGYVPLEFLRDTDAHAAAIRAIIEMPAVTQARFAPELGPSLENTWKLVAEQGLFAYDCDPNGGPYTLVAAPFTPIRITALPRSALDVVSPIVLPAVRFESQSRVTSDDICKTGQADPE